MGGSGGVVPVVFDENTGYPPPGRTRVSADEAEQELVRADRFNGSRTRRWLWDGLGQYLARFFELESRHSDALNGRGLIHALWLGGSFVSTKMNPNNLDLTVILDGPARETLKGLPGAKWLSEHAFRRDAQRGEFGVSPLRVVYWPVVSVFQPTAWLPHEREYFSGRGAWDDWWQRCRSEGQTPEPSLDTVHVQRGYLEVVP